MHSDSEEQETRRSRTRKPPRKADEEVSFAAMARGKTNQLPQDREQSESEPEQLHGRETRSGQPKPRRRRQRTVSRDPVENFPASDRTRSRPPSQRALAKGGNVGQGKRITITRSGGGGGSGVRASPQEGNDPGGSDTGGSRDNRRDDEWLEEPQMVDKATSEPITEQQNTSTEERQHERQVSSQNAASTTQRQVESSTDTGAATTAVNQTHLAKGKHQASSGANKPDVPFDRTGTNVRTKVQHRLVPYVDVPPLRDQRPQVPRVVGSRPASLGDTSVTADVSHPDDEESRVLRSRQPRAGDQPAKVRNNLQEAASNVDSVGGDMDVDEEDGGDARDRYAVEARDHPEDDFNGDELFGAGAGDSNDDEHVYRAPPSESDASGSDYSATTRERKRRRERAVNREESTEDEDEELEAEMQEELVEDEMVPDTRRQRSDRSADKQRGSRVDKGKGRAEPLPTVRTESEEPRESTVTTTERKKPGPLSQAAREEIAEFGAEVEEAADELADKYGKSRQAILIQAGLGIKSSRAPNTANVFRKWYKVHYPKGNGVSTDEYQDEMNQAYKIVCKDADQADEDESPSSLEAIMDWYKEYEKEESGEPRSSRSISSRLRAARDRLTLVAASFSKQEELEVIGAVVYTGMDAGAKQMSAMFGSSDLVRQVIAESQVDVRRILDKLATAFKYLKDRQTKEGLQIMEQLLDRTEDVETKKENTRDFYRKLLGRIVLPQLRKLDPSITKVPWENWCNFAYKKRVRIDDWEEDVQPPGPGFNIRKLSQDALQRLCEPYLKHEKDGTDEKYPRIVAWPERDIGLVKSKDRVDEATRIPLVRSKGFMVLQYLGNSTEWRKDSGTKVKKSSGSQRVPKAGPVESSHPPLNRLAKPPPKALPTVIELDMTDDDEPKLALPHTPPTPDEPHPKRSRTQGRPEHGQSNRSGATSNQWTNHRSANVPAADGRTYQEFDAGHAAAPRPRPRPRMKRAEAVPDELSSSERDDPHIQHAHRNGGRRLGPVLVWDEQDEIGSEQYSAFNATRNQVYSESGSKSRAARPPSRQRPIALPGNSATLPSQVRSYPRAHSANYDNDEFDSFRTTSQYPTDRASGAGARAHHQRKPPVARREPSAEVAEEYEYSEAGPSRHRQRPPSYVGAIAGPSRPHGGAIAGPSRPQRGEEYFYTDQYYGRPGGTGDYDYGDEDQYDN